VTWEHPIALFSIVVVAATGCAIAAGVVIAVARRDDLAELGLIGSFTMSVSLLPLVHGITVPGVLYGPNDATSSSVFWALPIAVIPVLPLVAPRSKWSRAISSRWRVLVAGHLAVVVGVSAGLLVRPSLLPVWQMGSVTAVSVAVAALMACAALSYRQLRLSMIGGSQRPLAVSLGFAAIGASSLVWVSRAPFTPGFWSAHLLDVAGVLGVAIGALVAFRQQLDLRNILRPLTVHTPLAAFELGLEPLVHQFVASLHGKDPITRDHVVRSSELAMAVGERLGVGPHQLHILGLGALLHDLGKLEVPDEVLNKPGRLDDAEYAIIKRHPLSGEALVRRSGVLADIAPIVRGHHERIDGRGYPDGLAGDEIPLLARIVSACDAFDAMAHTRQYRDGMGRERAFAILREHSGTQWDPTVVEALIDVVERGRVEEGALAAVGHDGIRSSAADPWCGCGDALPPEAVAELASVDR
jgi:HD-GYP domain-containing protein (c-di-GMP phosphodiesterase class II)